MEELLHNCLTHNNGDRDYLVMMAPLCTNRQACGRTGEAMFASLKASSWNMDEDGLDLAWSEIKITDQQILTINSDSNSYVLDFYWTYAVYLICGGVCRHENDGEEKFLFPNLAHSSNALRKINDIIHKFLPSEDEKIEFNALGSM